MGRPAWLRPRRCATPATWDRGTRATPSASTTIAPCQARATRTVGMNDRDSRSRRRSESWLPKTAVRSSPVRCRIAGDAEAESPCPPAPLATASIKPSASTTSDVSRAESPMACSSAELASPVQHRHEQRLEHGERDDRQQDAVEQVVAEVVDAHRRVELGRRLAPRERVRLPSGSSGPSAFTDAPARRPRRAAGSRSDVTRRARRASCRAVASGMSTMPSSTSRMPVRKMPVTWTQLLLHVAARGLRGDHEARAEREAEPVDEPLPHHRRRDRRRRRGSGPRRASPASAENRDSAPDRRRAPAPAAPRPPSWRGRSP